MMLHFFKEMSPARLPRSLLHQTAAALTRDHPRLTGTVVSCIFCGDHRMRSLNREFRNLDQPTDVLTFAYNEPDLLGEIYISLNRARTQGRTYGTGYYGEIHRLFVHGVFHLLGFTHSTTGERRIMEAEERRYI